MIDVSASPVRRFSWKAFFQGLALVFLLYAGLAVWLQIKAPATLMRQQARLASQTVTIAHPPPVIYGPPVNVATNVAATPAPQPETIIKGSPPPADGKKAPITALPPITVTSMPVTMPPPASAIPVKLPSAPINGLFEASSTGRLPIIRQSDGLTPFKAYRRPFDRAAVKGPIVSIVIVDLGLSASSLQAALTTLPPDISFDVSPYAAAPDTLVNTMRDKGHEVWLTLPVESEDYPRVDTGADTLLISASAQQNMQKLAQVLGSTIGYAGLITNDKPAFMKSAADTRPVLTDLYTRGLGFIDGSETPAPLPQTLALSQHAAYASVDSWLDTSATPADIEKELSALEQKARAHGSAIGVIHPLPVSLKEVQKWLATLPNKNIVLAPLSAQTGS